MKNVDHQIPARDNSKDAGIGDGNKVTQTMTNKRRTNNNCGSMDKGNSSNQKANQSKPSLSGDNAEVSKVSSTAESSEMDEKDDMNESREEILHPIYEINEQVRYAAGGQIPVRIGQVSRYFSKKFMNYDACPGYNILFRKGKGDQVCLWCPYFQLSPLNKNNATIKRVSDLVQCYSKERGNCGEVLGSNESKSYPDTTKPVSVEDISKTYDSDGGDENDYTFSPRYSKQVDEDVVVV
eukprot:jgi/Psemu1/61066/gm1.61066_g